VVSLLIESTVAGEGLSDEKVLAFCRNLFPAAIDTSTNSLGSLLYQILKHPERLESLEGDAKSVDAAIDEMLRLEPPLVMLPRRCVKQLELGDYTIETGDDVRLSLAGANLDPARFENPHVFDPSRKVRDVTFGHGEHFCLGSHMARRVLETGVKTLLGRFPKMRLCTDKPVEFVGGVLRGPRELWVEPRG
jgi:cytochrome P450